MSSLRKSFFVLQVFQRQWVMILNCPHSSILSSNIKTRTNHKNWRNVVHIWSLWPNICVVWCGAFFHKVHFGHLVNAECYFPLQHSDYTVMPVHQTDKKNSINTCTLQKIKKLHFISVLSFHFSTSRSHVCVYAHMCVRLSRSRVCVYAHMHARTCAPVCVCVCACVRVCVCVRI